MGSFGDRLKKEREQRSISLDDIALSTKIGTRMLRALEEEKFEQLPGGIFNKGFVRAYARHLGLDENETIAQYQTALSESQIKEAPPSDPAIASKSEAAVERHPVVVRESRQPERAADLPWGLLALALLLVALALASWSYYHRAPEIEKSKSSPSPTAEVASPSTGDASARNTATSPQRSSSLPEKGRGPSSPIPTKDQTSAKDREAAQTSPLAQAALHESTASGGFTVLLKGNDQSEECWVSIAADGQPPVELTLVAPYEKVIQAKDQVVVKAGSAGAVDIFFNGKKLPAQGGYGTVKTLTFRADGLQPLPSTR
jgi:cytoskeleton protein RodZ